MAFIYINEKEIYVTASHPNFELAKGEETARLLNEENSSNLEELTDEQYTENQI